MRSHETSYDEHTPRGAAQHTHTHTAFTLPTRHTRFLQYTHASESMNLVNRLQMHTAKPRALPNTFFPTSSSRSIMSRSATHAANSNSKAACAIAIAIVTPSACTCTSNKCVSVYACRLDGRFSNSEKRRSQHRVCGAFVGAFCVLRIVGGG